MPASTSALDINRSKINIFMDNFETMVSDEKLTHSTDSSSSSLPPRLQTKFHSQPFHVSFPFTEKFELGLPRKEVVQDECYNSFKTWSGRLDSQISNLREAGALPAVERYFDALEGPELETLKVRNFILSFYDCMF